MTTFQIRALGMALRTLDRVAPSRAARYAYDAFCTPPGQHLRTAAERRALQTLSANLDTAEAHRIETPDATVHAWHWRTSVTPSSGRVLLVHGWTADARVMTLFVEPLRRAGFDVVALDLPAHGRSSGKRLNMPIGARTVLAVSDALGPFHGVIAHSFGGLVTALAAEGGAPLARALPVQRLVLISTPHSLPRLLDDWGAGLNLGNRLQKNFAAEISIAAGRPVETISAGGMLKVAAMPTLVIQDDDDDIVPASDGPAIASTSGAVLRTTKGLGHRRIVVMPAIVRMSVRFLKGEPV